MAESPSSKRMHFQDAAMSALAPVAREVLDRIPEVAVVSVVITWADLSNSTLPFGFTLGRKELSPIPASDLLRSIQQTSRLMKYLLDSYENQVVTVVQAGEEVSRELKRLEKLKEAFHAANPGIG